MIVKIKNKINHAIYNVIFIKKIKLVVKIFLIFIIYLTVLLKKEHFL